jgi:hypothetical protein
MAVDIQSSSLAAMQHSLVILKKENIKLSKYQTYAIAIVIQRQDTIVCLPTGHGKSLIFKAVPRIIHSGPLRNAKEYTPKRVDVVFEMGISTTQYCIAFQGVPEDTVVKR